INEQRARPVVGRQALQRVTVQAVRRSRHADHAQTRQAQQLQQIGVARLLYRHGVARTQQRSEEHTSELQSLMRISYAVFCLNKKNTSHTITSIQPTAHTI